MEQTIEAKYERLGKIIYKTSLSQCETFIENREKATELEKIGAQLFVMSHLLNLLDRHAHVEFRRVIASAFSEFSIALSLDDCLFNFVWEVNNKFESVPQFLINRYQVFQTDYEIAVKRGMHIGHLGFYCFYINLLSNPNLQDQSVILKIVGSDTPFRTKLNERLSTYIPIWRDKTVPVMLKSAFPN